MGLTIEPTWEGRGDEEGEPGRAVVTTPALAPVTPQMPLDLEGMIDALAADPIAPSLALPSTLTAEERKRAKALVAQILASAARVSAWARSGACTFIECRAQWRAKMWLAVLK